MGPTKQTQNTVSNSLQKTAPWEEAVPQVKGLLGALPNPSSTGLTGAESGALNTLSANAGAGNPYAPKIGGLANDLLSGGQDRSGYVTGAYNDLKSSLTPYANMDTNPYSNQAFTKFTGDLTSDITDRIKSQYAGAGYSPVTSGDFPKTLGEGIARGVAPTFLQANNDLEARKLGAIGSLYQAGGNTAGLLSGLDQTALGNRMQGIDASSSALMANDSGAQRQLEIEAMRRGIPLQNLGQLANLIIPMAQLGGTTEGRSNSTTTAETQVPVAQQILGGALGGVGLLGGMGGFGPTGWLYGSGKSGAGLLNGLFGGRA